MPFGVGEVASVREIAAWRADRGAGPHFGGERRDAEQGRGDVQRSAGAVRADARREDGERGRRREE